MAVEVSRPKKKENDALGTAGMGLQIFQAFKGSGGKPGGQADASSQYSGGGSGVGISSKRSLAQADDGGAMGRRFKTLRGSGYGGYA